MGGQLDNDKKIHIYLGMTTFAEAQLRPQVTLELIQPETSFDSEKLVHLIHLLTHPHNLAMQRLRYGRTYSYIYHCSFVPLTSKQLFGVLLIVYLSV